MVNMNYQVFETPVGFFGISWIDDVVDEIALGMATREAALRNLSISETQLGHETGTMKSLAARLLDYSSGNEVDFSRTAINLAGRTVFQQAVLRCCQQIPWGQSISYGELARQAGYPRAARAVGGVMRSNRFPLVVP